MVIYVALGALLVGVIYFVLIVSGVALMLSPAAGAAAFFFWRLIDPERRGRAGLLRVIVTATTGPAAAALIAFLTGIGRTPGWDAVGIVLAGALAVAMYSYRAQGRDRTCSNCQRPVEDRAGFDCPRCNDRVCARPTCWNAKYFRCIRCHKREIVIFPIAEKWWAARLGPRVMKGECLSCYKEAHETDLRECGQCHWSMCKRCWDYYNGVCQRCDWTIPNRPARLTAFTDKTKGSRSSSSGDHAADPHGRRVEQAMPPGTPRRAGPAGRPGRSRQR